MIRIISAKNVHILNSIEKNNKKTVELILDQVKKDGDLALRKFERKFNGVDIKQLLVSKKEIMEAKRLVTKEQITAINVAKSRLEVTETAIKKQLKKIVINNNDTKIVKSFVPLDSVGCYVPGGLARYASSVIMSVVPAKLAGVKKIIITTPPNKEGKIDPMILVAADLCGANMIFKVGGAHAIAALSFGTRSIPQVDKIVGPGGAIVTTAKYLVSDNTSIDMLAGPTELAIIGDDTADPKIIALDLISQAEHSTDTKCCLITASKNLANKVLVQLKTLILNLKRKEIVQSSLQKNGFIAICEKMSDAISLVNRIAPEHLEIIAKNPNEISKKIRTAGLILIGENTPSAASDYLLGTNHILPTGRFGRSRSSLSILDFLKIKTTVESKKHVLKKIKPHMKILTDFENLPNHYEAIGARL